MARFTLTTFTPGEAEKITGLSTAMQRDWRRRGFIAGGDGHARFNAFTLGELLTLKLLADAGVGPQQGQSYARWTTAGIVWHALQWVDAYEGDHQRTLADAGPMMNSGPATWGQKVDWLARATMKANGHHGAPGRFFIRWADGSERWEESLDTAFGQHATSDPQVTGPVVVFDLQALGGLLVDRAARPLVHVDLTDSLKSASDDADLPSDGATPNA